MATSRLKKAIVTRTRLASHIRTPSHGGAVPFEGEESGGEMPPLGTEEDMKAAAMAAAADQARVSGGIGCSSSRMDHKRRLLFGNGLG